MTGVVVSRSVDTVREDFRHYVNTWIGNGNQDHTLFTSEETALLNSMAIKLQEPDKMLTKEEAKLAKDKLEEYIISDMESTIRRHERPFLHVDIMSALDEMTIYADIYYVYLRPGSYSLT